MNNKWSYKITLFFEKLLTVNFISCIWAIWAILSTIVFLTFVSSKLLPLLLDNNVDAIFDLGTNLKEIVKENRLLLPLLLAEVLLAGVLGIGWLIFKSIYFLLDKIQQLLGGKRE